MAVYNKIMYIPLLFIHLKEKDAENLRDHKKMTITVLSVVAGVANKMSGHLSLLELVSCNNQKQTWNSTKDLK